MNSEILTRDLRLKPDSANNDERSVMAIIATSQPVAVLRGGKVVDEVLEMGGAVIPQRVSLLDSHSRDSVSDIIGSAREFVATGDTIEAKIYFADTEAGRTAYKLYADGHATDFSVGYRILELDKTEKNIHRVTKWQIAEVSAAVIGADSLAKARSQDESVETIETTNEPKENIQEEKREMTEELKTQEAPPEVKVEKPVEVRKEVPNAPDYAAATIEAEREAALELAKRQEEAAMNERKRITAVTKEAQIFGLPSQKYITNGMTLDQARADILRQLAERQENHRIAPAEDEGDKIRKQISNAIEIRMGLPQDKEYQGQANQYVSMTLMEMAKDCLARKGENIRGLDIGEIAKRAMTSSDFANIISTTAYKSLKRGYNEKQYQWSQFCDVGSVPNFLTQTEVEISRGGVLTKLTSEAPEYPHKYFVDGSQTYKAETYAGAWRFTRKMLINDDLNAIYNVARMGETAARTVETVVFQYIESNPTMSDGYALFHTNHANIATGGTIDPPTVASFNAAELAMASHLDIDGVTKLNIMPVFMLAPIAIKGATRQFLASPYWNDEATLGTPDYSTATTRVNIWSGNRLVEIYTPHLTSTTAWYFLSAKGDHFQVFFLNGRQEPIMESAVDFDTKDLKVTVSLDFGVRVKDYRTVYYNLGT